MVLLALEPELSEDELPEDEPDDDELLELVDSDLAAGVLSDFFSAGLSEALEAFRLSVL